MDSSDLLEKYAETHPDVFEIRLKIYSGIQVKFIQE